MKPGASHDAGEGIRPEIQGLRAAAVMLVVLYHLWPQVLTGGFVGVDVFFVVSGFLITGHLLREVVRTGRAGLPAFWARRARRLLPAALLVLLSSAVLVLVFVPRVFWAQFFKETIASALYVQNWVLAADSVDYLAAGNAASAAQHYWSLSVEEQFYLVWPLLILLALLIARRTGACRTRVVAAVLGVVTVASLITSVAVTATDPSVAYFSTPVRAWEFGLGGVLALVPAAWLAQRSPRGRSVLAWAGWIAIAATGILFSSAIPFPSTTALLPVAGTLAVIAAGSPRARLAPTALVGLRPVQWLGGISYSVYLWHWPLIIVAPYVLSVGALGLPQKAAILGLTIVLAWATRRWIEDPARRARVLVSRAPRWTFAAALVGMAIVIAPAVTGDTIIRTEAARDAALRAQAAESPCFGAASLDPDLDCSEAVFPVISPDPALAVQDSPDIYFTDPPCFAADAEVVTCTEGSAGGTRVALIGDSHAAQWEPALRVIAEQRGWDLHLYLKTNCTFTLAQRGAQYDPCATWVAGVQAALAKDDPYDLVIVSAFTNNLEDEVTAGTVRADDAVAGFRSAWRPLIARGSTVLVIKDTPQMAADTVACVSQYGAAARCEVPAAEARGHRDLEYDAAADTAGAVRLVMDDWYCDAAKCYGVMGGVAMHTDPFHTTKTYAATLIPYLERGILSATGMG